MYLKQFILPYLTLIIFILINNSISLLPNRSIFKAGYVYCWCYIHIYVIIFTAAYLNGQ